MSSAVHKRRPLLQKQQDDEKDDAASNSIVNYGPFSESNILYWILGLRLVSIPLVQTYFAPDEYWQSLEVAHKLVYGYGFLTWEWKLGLRSYLHPLAIAVLFFAFKYTGLDSVSMLINGPRICQAVMSTFADVYFYRFVKEHFGKDLAIWTTLSLCTSWIWFYCASRTLMNTVETALACFAMYYYPWNLGMKQSEVTWKISKFTVITSLSVVLRPTSAAMWAPMYVWLLYKYFRHSTILVKMFLKIAVLALLTLAIATFVDRMIYGRWVFAHYHFLHFNVITGQGTYFGREPWHWYVTEGIPVITGPHLPLVAYGVYLTCRKRIIHSCREKVVSTMLLVICGSTVFMYSVPGHKEHRYLLNLVPILCFFSGISMRSFNRKWKKLAVAWLVVTNLVMVLYFGLVHQSAPLKVVDFLQKRAKSDLKYNTELTGQFALFLLPCHSTPYYSHIHHNVSMHFLTCHPDLEGYGKREYIDEQDTFYKNPKQWLDINVLQSVTPSNKCPDNLPKHIIMYDNLLPDVLPSISMCYASCFTTFHTHFPEGKTGQNMWVYCRFPNNDG
uniref:Mannosyltransferase n=1 Tax=Phallusia mammillata TaxID=59560 RepID=A0A6F9DNZ5_9ASCI|nr:GPI mannosyltransferase 3-like [Phallusia mammillata]